MKPYKENPLLMKIITKATSLILIAGWALILPSVRGNPSPLLESASPNEALEWNQIFVETLIAANTPNSSSQRLGAIVHTAMFDAFNGIERRYAPLFVREPAPRRASSRAAIVAAAYTALAGLFQRRG